MRQLRTFRWSAQVHISLKWVKYILCFVYHVIHSICKLVILLFIFVRRFSKYFTLKIKRFVFNERAMCRCWNDFYWCLPSRINHQWTKRKNAIFHSLVSPLPYLFSASSGAIYEPEIIWEIIKSNESFIRWLNKPPRRNVIKYFVYLTSDYFINFYLYTPVIWSFNSFIQIRVML